MRLTLRTLLAFMDEILEPQDAEDIGRKIQESEFAATLLHRTRDVMRRLRLAAPQDAGPGGAQDPNTVAEYLDNTLADDHVPEFERVCLESDVHLAEVASCHQILTLVLGSPAEVDPASRERMYRIWEEAAKRLEEEVAASGSPSSTPPELPSIQPAASPRPRPTVPDYLREPPRPWARLLRTAVLVVLGVAIAGGALYAMGQFEADRPLGKLWARVTVPLHTASSEPKVVKAEEKGAPPTAKVTNESPPKVEPVAPATSAPATLPSPPASRVEAPGPPAATVAPPQPQPSEKALPQPQVTTDLVKPEVGTTGTVVPPPAKSEVAPPKELPQTKPAPGAPTAPEASPSGATPAKAAASTPKGETTAPAVEPVGRLTSEREVLLELEPNTAEWVRAPAQGTINTGRKLLALPTFRPTIAMTAGMAIQLMGGAQVELQLAGEQKIPGLDIIFGQVVVRTLGEPNTRLWLQMEKRGGTLTLADADTTVAIDATRPLVPGTDPEKQPGPLTIDVYVVTGRALWQPSGAEAGVPLGAPARLRVSQAGAQADTMAKELPKWILSDPTGYLDRKASPILAESLGVSRPVSQRLQELADHRREEVRWLAVRCLGHIGRFGPMVSALNDAEQKAAWPNDIEELRSAVARNPAVAAQVRQAIEKEYGAEATKLFRMLWGFPEEELRREGSAHMLVENLDSDLLACRVLASWNLTDLTGLVLGYHPEAPGAQRQQAVQRWRQRIESEQFWKQSSRSKASENKTSGSIGRTKELGSPPNGPPLHGRKD